MSPRWNWDSPTPSLASECAPPPEQKGGPTRVRVRGWGSPNSDDWRKSVALWLLCDVYNQLQLPVSPKDDVQTLSHKVLAGWAWLWGDGGVFAAAHPAQWEKEAKSPN